MCNKLAEGSERDERFCSAAMGTEEGTPAGHVLLVSFAGQGHVNPLLRLAKLIASKGLLVTFSSSTDIGHKISASTDSDPSVPAPVGRGWLRFEFFSDGWDVDDPRRPDMHALMPHLAAVGPPAVADLIRRQAVPVSCVVNNPFVPWVLDIASEMGIPCAVLWIQSCAVYSTYYHYHHALAEFPTTAQSDLSVSLPGLPVMRPDELPTFLFPSANYGPLKEVILQQFHNLHKASWVLANTFDELEHDPIQAISEISPIIPVGPLVEALEPNKSGIKGDLLKVADCMEWLDAQELCSVVYVSVGSIVVLDREEMAEMAHGLRDAARPFLWVVRPSCRELLPEGFVEEMEGRGLVVGWSPQERVLAHRAVACFVTHCGWNSTLEALSAGVPVVAYPQWGDQVPDAKFLVEVYGVGVRLSTPVGRKELVSCVAAVIEGPEAEERRRKAVEWKEVARGALGEGGSSDRNIQAFVDEICRRATSGHVLARNRV